LSAFVIIYRKVWHREWCLQCFSCVGILCLVCLWQKSKMA